MCLISQQEGRCAQASLLSKDGMRQGCGMMVRMDNAAITRCINTLTSVLRGIQCPLIDFLTSTCGIEYSLKI